MQLEDQTIEEIQITGENKISQSEEIDLDGDIEPEEFLKSVDKLEKGVNKRCERAVSYASNELLMS